MPNNQQSLQSAQTGTDSSAVTSTNCSICRGRNVEKREAVNRSLAKGISLRDIEAMTGIAYRTVGNHAQHLPEIYKQAKEKGLLGQAVDVDSELKEQLAFAKDLRTAARGYLSDPETGEITLIPRSSEIVIIYEDSADRDNSGNPKKKRDPLDKLIERIERNNTVTALQAVVKHVDIRSFALDAIKVADVVIDKFARIAGSYKADNEQKQPQITYVVQVRQNLISAVMKLDVPPEQRHLIYQQAIPSAVQTAREIGKPVSEEDLRVEVWELVV